MRYQPESPIPCKNIIVAVCRVMEGTVIISDVAILEVGERAVSRKCDIDENDLASSSALAGLISTQDKKILRELGKVLTPNSAL